MATDDPLWMAIKAAHEWVSPDGVKRFPPNPRWEPSAASVGTENDALDQSLKEPVPTVPTVPTEKQKERASAADGVAADAWWTREERAAILEFEGGFSRIEAERRAAEELDL